LASAADDDDDDEGTMKVKMKNCSLEMQSDALKNERAEQLLPSLFFCHSKDNKQAQIKQLIIKSQHTLTQRVLFVAVILVPFLSLLTSLLAWFKHHPIKKKLPQNVFAPES